MALLKSSAKSTRRLDRMAGLLSEGEESISAVEAELRAKPVPTVVIRANTGKTKHLRLVWDTQYDSLMHRIFKLFDIDTNSFKEHRIADRKIYTKTPMFRLKIKRPLYCPDEIFLAGCVARDGGLPEYDKEFVIITNRQEWRAEFESFPRGNIKQMAGMADFLFQKLSHSFYTWRLDGALGFWQLAQSVVEQGVQSGIFTEDMLDLFLSSIQRAYADDARYNPGVYSTSASCWMALWWLSTLNGIAFRGERSTTMPSVANAHFILIKTAKWRAGSKQRAKVKAREREMKGSKVKKGEKRRSVVDDEEQQQQQQQQQQKKTSTRGAKVQTSWTGLLGWMLHHNIFSMFLKTHDYVLAQIEEFGPKFIKRWRADLVVLNLGYSLGLLRSLLRQSSISTHLRAVERHRSASAGVGSEADSEDGKEVPPTDVLGVESKRIWHSLFRLACMPGWAVVEGVTPNLEPMKLKDSVDRLQRIAIQRKLHRVIMEDHRITRMSIKATRELEDKYKDLKKERDPPALPAKKVTVLADAGQKPSGAKASMLMHLKAKAGKMTTKRRLYDADAQLLMGKSEDGRIMGVRAPGVVAADILLDQCLRGGEDALTAFDTAVGVGSLRQMINGAVPMRVRHCAVAILSCYVQSHTGRAILQASSTFHEFFPPLMALATLEPREGAPGVIDWKNGDRSLIRWMDFGSPIAEHAACAVWGLVKGLSYRATKLNKAEECNRLKTGVTMSAYQIQMERDTMTKSIRGLLQCTVEIAIGGHRAKINSSAGFLASAVATLAKEASIAELLMDLNIVYDGMEPPKDVGGGVEEVSGMQARVAKRRSVKEQRQAEIDAANDNPNELDVMVDPGTVNLMMESPVLSVLEAAAAIIGLLAERSMPHTGGMDGVYRRRLLENGAWSVLVRAVRVTNFETERLEETVAAGLMYLSAEVPRLITAGMPRRGGAPSAWKSSYLDKPLEELNLFVLTRGIDDLDSALDAHRVLLGARRPNTVKCIATGVWLLARCRGLQGPLGEIGCVGALVGALRRWYELNPDERAGGREMGEWVMNAINLMCNDDANLDRFAHSYKPKPPKDFAQLQLEQFKAEVMDTALLKLDTVGGPVTPDATQGVRWRPFGWQETAVRHHAPSETQYTEENESGYEDAIASKDPVQLLVQMLLLKGRTPETYKKIKVQVVNMLKRVVQRQAYRQRLVDMGAGPFLWATAHSQDASFDGTICSGAAYIWIYVAACEEGRSAAWWGGLDERIEAAAMGQPAGSVGLEGATLGQAILAVDLMQRVEVSQQRVGARAAANLSGESERSKVSFLKAGGIDGLLAVARSPLSDEATTLAAVTFNNISSCVPYQKELADKALFIILDISQKFRASRGISNLQLPDTGIAEELSTAGPKERAMQVLRATAGALWNLSRNPENRSAFYKAELKHHTLSSLEDLKDTDPEMYRACRDYGRVVEKQRRHKPKHDSMREKFTLTSAVSAQQSQRDEMLKETKKSASAAEFLSKYSEVPHFHSNDGHDDAPPAGALAAASGQTGMGLTGMRLLGKMVRKAKGTDLAQVPGAKLSKLSDRLRQPTASLWNELVVDRHDGPTVMMPVTGGEPAARAVKSESARRESGPVATSPERTRTVRLSIKGATAAAAAPAELPSLAGLLKQLPTTKAAGAASSDRQLDDSAAVFEEQPTSSRSRLDSTRSSAGAEAADEQPPTFGQSPHRKACTRWQPSIAEYKIIRATDGVPVTFRADQQPHLTPSPRRCNAELSSPAVSDDNKTTPRDYDEPPPIPARRNALVGDGLSLPTKTPSSTNVITHRTSSPPATSRRGAGGTRLTSAQATSRSAALSASSSRPIPQQQQQQQQQLALFDALPGRWAAAAAEVKEAAALEVVVGSGVARRRAVNFKAESLQAAKAFSQSVALRSSASPSPERVRPRDDSAAETSPPPPPRRPGDETDETGDDVDEHRRQGIAGSAGRVPQKHSPPHARPVFGTSTARFDARGDYSAAVTEDNRYTPAHPVKEFTSTRIDMWRTVAGSKVFEDIPKQTLPDHSRVIMYTSRKTRVDELYLGWAPNPPVATTLEELGHKGLPGCDESAASGNQPRAEILHAVAELPYKPRPPKVPEPHPLPHVYDKLPDYSFGMAATLEEWIEITREEDVVDPEDADDPEWVLEKGGALFARKKESDFKSMMDSAKGMRRMLDTDWAACVYRFTFMEFLVKDLTLARREQIMKEVTTELRKHYALLVAMYGYYSSLHPPELFKMTLADFRALLLHFKLVDDQVEGARQEEMEAIFGRINPDLAEQEGVTSEKYSLFRSEFIELIVRIAYNKYMHGRRPATKVWAEAVSMLFRDHLACDSLTHIEITLDRDEFRRQRLYRKPVDTYLRKHERTFTTLFNYFKTVNQEETTAYLPYHGWELLLEQGGIINDFFTPRDAMNCFLWSRTYKLDDTKKRPKVTGMTYVDFLEGLGRVAEVVSPPAVPDLRRQGYESDTPTYEYYHKVFHTDSGAPPLPDRLSSLFDYPKTRPLQHKLQQIMEVLLLSLAEKMGFGTAGEMMVKLKELAAAGPSPTTTS